MGKDSKLKHNKHYQEYDNEKDSDFAVAGNACFYRL